MSNDLDTLIAKYKEDFVNVLTDSVLDLGARVKEGTPKDTGRARRSWSDNGAIKIGKKYRYTSNLEYIIYLEYGSKWTEPLGHSPQAPHGMLRINVVKWPQIVKKYV